MGIIKGYNAQIAAARVQKPEKNGYVPAPAQIKATSTTTTNTAAQIAQDRAQNPSAYGYTPASNTEVMASTGDTFKLDAVNGTKDSFSGIITDFKGKKTLDFSGKSWPLSEKEKHGKEFYEVLSYLSKTPEKWGKYYLELMPVSEYDASVREIAKKAWRGKELTLGEKAVIYAVTKYDNYLYSQDMDERITDKVDCSSMAVRTYKTLGYNITYDGKANSEGIREWAKNNHKFVDMGERETGDILLKPGHVAIYVGELNGTNVTFEAVGQDEIAPDDQVTLVKYTDEELENKFKQCVRVDLGKDGNSGGF